jgi:hypothetical protein
VPGHAGITGNEETDGEAKRALEDERVIWKKYGRKEGAKILVEHMKNIGISKTSEQGKG